MKYYIEAFSADLSSKFYGYFRTDVKPEQVAEVFNLHPVGLFKLSPESAEALGIKGLNFEYRDYNLFSGRDYINETYEWNGECLYPSPVPLTDFIDTIFVKKGQIHEIVK